MKHYKKFKRKNIIDQKRSTRLAVSKFLQRHGGSKEPYSHQYWEEYSQWGDFEFVHPSRNILVRVMVRTLVNAYNDECEDLSRASIPANESHIWDNFMSSFTPNYGKSCSKSRPKIISYTMNEDSPENKNARRERWENDKLNLAALENSGTVFIAPSISAERTHYGLWVNLVVDKIALAESDLASFKSIVIGETKLDITSKTFSRKDVLSAFGAPADAPETSHTFQSLAVKM